MIKVTRILCIRYRIHKQQRLHVFEAKHEVMIYIGIYTYLSQAVFRTYKNYQKASY